MAVDTELFVILQQQIYYNKDIRVPYSDFRQVWKS